MDENSVINYAIFTICILTQIAFFIGILFTACVQTISRSNLFLVILLDVLKIFFVHLGLYFIINDYTAKNPKFVLGFLFLNPYFYFICLHLLFYLLKRKILMSFCALMVSEGIGVICTLSPLLFISYIWRHPIEASNVWELAFPLVLCLSFSLLLFCCIYISLKDSFQSFHKIAAKYNPVLWGILFFYLMSGIIINLINITIGCRQLELKNWNSIPFIAFTLFSICSFFFFLSIRSLLIDYRNLFLRQNLLSQHYDALQEQIKTTRQFYHDINEHWDTLEEIFLYSAPQSTSENARKENIPVPDKAAYCDDFILSSVISDKIEQCHALGIHTTICAHALSCEAVQRMDMLGLLHNLFNNAIEACQNAEKAKKRLHFDCTRSTPYLFLEMRNGISPEAGKRKSLTTQKSNKQLHGTGLTIIQDIAHKYHGSVTVNWKSDEFIITVSLIIKE